MVKLGSLAAKIILSKRISGNTKAKTVSFRRSKDCDADVSLIAKKLCDGGGHPASAGGKLTNQFASLTKQFTPC